jgi:hypothetical protein
LLTDIVLGKQYPEMEASIRPVLNGNAEWTKFEDSVVKRRTTEPRSVDNDIAIARRYLEQQPHLLNLPECVAHERLCDHVRDFCNKQWPSLDLLQVDRFNSEFFTPTRTKAFVAALAHIIN